MVLTFIPIIFAVTWKAAAVGVAAGIVTAVSRITYTLIMDFFLRHRSRTSNNPSLQRVTSDVTDAIRDGNVKRIYTGLFDPVQQEFAESTIYESSSVDPEVIRAHRDSKVVIWN